MKQNENHKGRYCLDKLKFSRSTFIIMEYTYYMTLQHQYLKYVPKTKMKVPQEMHVFLKVGFVNKHKHLLSKGSISNMLNFKNKFKSQ